MIWLTLTGSLLWAWSPAFWVLPTASLGESAAAASLGLINSVGALGGFVGPACIGYLLADGRSHAFVVRLCSVVFALAAIPILLTRIPPEPQVTDV
jgi:ACS family tartrate transporter-like MFS transporter